MPPDPQFSITEVDATYTVNRTGSVEAWRLQLTLEDGAVVREGDRQLVYRLRTWLGPRPFAERHYLLDRDLRVLREDHPCEGPVNGPCRDARIQWSIAGRLPPLGFGLPLIAKGGDGVDYQTFGREFHLSLESYHDGNSMWINSTDEPIFAGHPDASLTGRFVYKPPAVFPAQFVLLDGDGAYATGFLTGADVAQTMPSLSVGWNQTALDAPLGTTYEYFPGEDADDFARGRPYRDAIDALREQSSEAETVLRGGGCLVRYRIVPKETAGALGLGDSATHLVWLQAPDNRTTSWEISEDRSSRLIEPTYTVGPPEPEERLPQCVRKNEIPPPRIDSSSVFAWFYREGLNDTPPYAFSYTWSPGFLEEDQPDWWVKMTILSMPPDAEGGIIQPYRFEVFASSGHLETVFTDIETVQRLNGKSIDVPS